MADTLHSLADLPDIVPAANADADTPDPKLSAALDDAFDAAEAEAGDPGDDDADPKPVKADKPADKKPTEKPAVTKEKPAAETKPTADKPTSEKPADAKDGKPPTPDAAKTEDETDAEVDKIKLQKGAHPKTQEGFKALGKVAKERGAEIKRLANEIKERDAKLQEAAKVAPVSDEERRELEELRTRDFIHNPEKSRRITQEFDTKLSAATDTLLPLLTRHGLPATKAEAKTVNVGGKEVPGLSVESLREAGGIGAMPYAWWEANVLNNTAIDGRTRATAARLVNEYFDVQEGRAAAIEKASADRKGEEARLAKEAEEGGKQFWETVRGDLTARQKEAGERLQPKEIPAGATAAQKAEIEAHNARNADIAKKVAEALGDLSPKGLANLGFNVAERLYYQGEAERLNKELETTRKELETHKTELSKIKSAGQISRARSAVPIGNIKRGAGTVDDNFAAAEADAGR